MSSMILGVQHEQLQMLVINEEGFGGEAGLGERW